ncbi:MAG: hypothetical protein E6G50_09460 [Actinobacteria bacterium]|nr:MAG: hypothetical protein E6G50_09460 [Actinomycetota bacterium]
MSFPSKLELGFEVSMTLLAPALLDAELLQVAASLLELVRERFRLETMHAFVLLETTNLLVTLRKCTLTLRKRVLGLIVSAPSKRQLAPELTQTLLSRSLLSPQRVQLSSHVAKLARPRFRFEL